MIARYSRKIEVSRVTRKSDLEFGFIAEARIGNGNGDLVLSLTLHELNQLIAKGQKIQYQIYTEMNQILLDKEEENDSKTL